jgi:hypothetical protein
MSDWYRCVKCGKPCLVREETVYDPAECRGVPIEIPAVTYYAANCWENSEAEPFDGAAWISSRLYEAVLEYMEYYFDWPKTLTHPIPWEASELSQTEYLALIDDELVAHATRLLAAWRSAA